MFESAFQSSVLRLSFSRTSLWLQSFGNSVYCMPFYFQFAHVEMHERNFFKSNRTGEIRLKWCGQDSSKIGK